MSTTLFSNPKDRQSLVNMIKEASDSKIRIQSEKDLINSIKERAKEELDVKPALFNALLKTYHEQSLAEVVTKTEELTGIYEELFGPIED